MRRLLGLALFAPLLAGCGWFGGFAPFPGATHSSVAKGSGKLVRVAPAPSAVARWVHLERLGAKAIPGAKLFDSSGCTTCHTYAGSGRSLLGGPDLTAIGRRHLGIRLQIQHLRVPASVVPGSPMPGFASLGARQLHELAVFLEASKGVH
jgi:mono/diheme cytochrome c family protein